jgi:hypothetical protein
MNKEFIRNILKYYVDRKLVASSSTEVPKELANETNIFSFLEFLERNKLAPLPFVKFLKHLGFDIPIEIEKHARTYYEEHVKKYLVHLNDVAEAIEESGIKNYVFIKTFDPNKYIQTDIDVAVCNPREIKTLSLALINRGYRIYKFRLLADPLKLMATKDIASSISIDIYPGVKWVGVKAIECTEVIENAISKKISDKIISLRVPDPADSLYIIATHAFYHTKIYLGEVLHGIELIRSNEVSYTRLRNNAEKYGMKIALQVYVESMSNVYRALYQEPLATIIVDNYIRVKGNDIFPDFTLYPLNISLKTLFLNHIHHLVRTRYDNIIEYVKSLLTPFLNVGSILIGEK